MVAAGSISKLSPVPDVVVIGGGFAGLCAAISAREAGATVLLLERAPRHMRGGNSRHTRNLRASHDGPVHTLEGIYGEEEYWQDLFRVTGGVTDETLARLMIRGSRSLLDWVVARGVRLQPSLSGTLSLGRTNAFFLGGGCALLNALYLTAERIGVVVEYSAKVTSVVVVQGSFRKLSYSQDGLDTEVFANALVAAAGGFQADLNWLAQAWGPGAANFIVRGTPYNDGVVLRCLMDQGLAVVGDAAQCHAVAIDARAPKFDGGIVSRLDCVPFGIVVNAHGRRFYDEGEDFWPKRYAIWGRLVAEQPDQRAYALIDSTMRNYFMPSVYPPLEANSLDALAEQIDVPADALGATVAEFNQAVVSGSFTPDSLDDCHTRHLAPPKTHWAQRIEQPPFLAYPLRPGITFTYLGVQVDAEARVHLCDGSPSANIYAAGEIMAGNILGQGYCAGTGMSISGVFGRIAGEQAACHS
jgi:tricarballylate dehydrogenase